VRQGFVDNGQEDGIGVVLEQDYRSPRVDVGGARGLSPSLAAIKDPWSSARPSGVPRTYHAPRPLPSRRRRRSSTSEASLHAASLEIPYCARLVRLRAPQKCLPGRREFDPPLRPTKQAGAEFILQAPYLLAQWRLRDVKPCGSPTEMQLLGDSEKRPQVSKLHAGMISRDKSVVSK